ncbi:hypothetical protein GCM10027168_64860 [Streptomyces capparidis]
MKATAATRRSRGLAAGLLAAALLPGGATAMAATPAPPPSAPAPRIVPGEPGAAAVPVVEVDDTHATVVPRDEAYRFLGKPGTWYWETADVPWEAGEAQRAGRSPTGVEGPGDVAAFGLGADGEPVVRFHSAGRLPDHGDPPPGAAARWAFTAPGTYRLAFDADGERPGTATVYEVRVGDAAVAGPAGGDTTAPAPSRPGEAPPADGAAPGTGDASEGAGPGAGPGGDGEPSGAGPRTNEPLTRAPAAAADGTVVSEKKVLDEGHLDIAARVVDGRMQIHLKDGTVPGETTWREPSSVVLHVKPAARNEVPDNEDLAFLGKAGDPVWLLDQVQQDGLLWPGWSTENIEAGATTGGVRFTLEKVQGPGHVALFTYDGISGASVLFNSGDGVPDSFDVPRNTHAHGGWAFGKEGVFRLTLTMTGTLPDGRKTGDTETIAFAVGDMDPNSVTPGDGSGSGGGSGSGSGGGSGSGSGSGSSGTPGTSGSDSGTSGSGGSASGSSGSSGGSMASTGAGDPVPLGAAAAGLAAAGAGVLWLSRRRSGGGTPA